MLRRCPVYAVSLLLATATACGGESSTSQTQGETSETGGESTTGTDTDTDTTDTDTETAGPIDEPVRFIAFGDGGEGNEAQYAVADAVEQICADRGCDFALYLGDNFYDDGVVSVDDQQFQDKFELPYADIGFRFYIVLGNHDYGAVIPEWDKSEYEIEYTNYSEKWFLPNEWYSWTAGNVEFFALDTHRMMLAETLQEQRDWLAGALAASTAKWKIGLAHHPYISNGAHGNAGNYEGLNSTFLAGGNIKDTFDAQVCGTINVFFSGHDHTRQWLHPTCGTQFIVSGAAAKTTDLERRNNNPVDFEDDQKEGFMWVEIIGEQMTGAFYDRDGNLDFEKTITLADISG